MSSLQRQVQRTQEPKQSQNTRVPPTKEDPKEKNSGMWGWLENTGDWIADQYDNVTTGVGDWANGVRDSANDIWDVVESSSFDAKDGIWGLDTDLDELQDVAALEGISLDREASDNQVRMEINRNTGELTLKCSSLALNSLSFEGFTVGSVSMSDVHITVENASMDAGFLGTLSAKKGGTENAPQNVTLRAGAIVGHNIHIQDPTINDGQAITLEQITLDNFQLQANGSKDLFEDAPNQASFSVSNAVLQGLQTTQNGSTIGGDIAMSGANASFDSNNDSGSLGIDQLNASQVVAGSNRIENSQFQGIQANIAPSGNGSGGHLATVSTNQAAVQGLDTDGLDASSLSGSGVSAQFNTESQQLNASAMGLNASNMEGMGGNIESASVNNLMVSSDLDDNLHSGSAGSVSATNATYGNTSIAQANMTNLAGSSSSSGQAASLSSGSLSDIAGYGHTAELLTIGGASVNNVAGAQGVKVDSSTLQGYQSGFGTVDQANLSGLNLRHHDGHSSGSVDSAAMTQANLLGTSVNQATVTGSSFSNNQQGSTLNIDGASATGLRGFGTQADSVSLQNAAAHGNGNLTQSGFSVGNVSGSNIGHDAGSIGTLSINDIQGNRNNDSYDASVGSVTANDANVNGLASIGTISGTNASVQATLGEQNEYAANLDRLSLSDVTGDTFGTTVGNATFSGAEISGTDTTSLHARLASGEVNDFAMQGASIEQASVHNLQGDLENGNGDVRLDKMAFQNAKYEDTLHIQNGTAQNLRTHGTAQAQQGSMGSAEVHGMTVTQPQSISHIGEASMTGGHFAHQGGGKGSIGVDNVGAQDIHVDITDMDKSTSVSGATENPVSNVDFTELLTSGARRLDNANIQAQVGLNHGTMGEGFGSVDIDQGTTLNANINVANNRIQDGSNLSTNKALDTALFTSVKGGYVEDGELKADVRGWFDMGISEDINSSMGLDGKQLHSLGNYAEAIAQMPDSNESATPNPVNMSTLRATGNASLSDGVVSAGDANLTLSGAASGSNQMEFETTHQQIAMKFAQLLASSFQLNTSLGQGQTGEVAVDNGSFTVNPQKGTARGLVDSVSVSDIQIDN